MLLGKKILLRSPSARASPASVGVPLNPALRHSNRTFPPNRCTRPRLQTSDCEIQSRLFPDENSPAGPSPRSLRPHFPVFLALSGSVTPAFHAIPCSTISHLQRRNSHRGSAFAVPFLYPVA